MNKTALHRQHLQLGARMTDFHGWEMPLYYTSILEEHRCVRQAAGVFDVSHMGQILISGADAERMLNRLVASDITNVGIRRACYTLVLNEQGGIVDDLIINRLAPDEFLVIVNSSNRAKDLDWFLQHRHDSARVADVSSGRSILAVQGPQACQALEKTLGLRVASLGRFDAQPLRGMGERAWVARTGYTGGDGFELFLEDPQAIGVWERLLERVKTFGVAPAGLGARDILRIEAGLRLYGSDMDEATSPYEADLGWTVAINKPVEFIGKPVLLTQKTQGTSRKLIGFELTQGPVPRQGCALVVGDRAVGTVTSGTFSPLLNKPIGMGYVETASSKPGTALTATIRNQRYTATVVKLPFFRPERQAGTNAVRSPTTQAV